MNEENLQPKQSTEANSIAKSVKETQTEVVRRLVVPDSTIESNPGDHRSPTVQDRGGLETLIEAAASKEASKEPEVVRKLVIPTESEESSQ